MALARPQALGVISGLRSLGPLTLPLRGVPLPQGARANLYCDGANRWSNRWPAVEPNLTLGLTRGEISKANV